MHASCSQIRARGEGVLSAGEGQLTSPAVGRSRGDPREGTPALSTLGLEEAQQAVLAGSRKSHRPLQAHADGCLMAGEVPHEQTLPPLAAKHAMQAGRQAARRQREHRCFFPTKRHLKGVVFNHRGSDFLGVPLQNLCRN